MPLATSTKILGLNDVKIAKLLTDSASAPTYATSIDIPGAQELALAPKFTSKELRGDEMIIDTYSKLDSIEFTVTFGKLPLDALAIFLGGAVTATGTTPAQTQTYSLKGTDVPQYFKLEGQSKYTEAGDVHVVLYKCKASDVSYALKGEDYATVSVKGVAIPTVSDQKVKDVILNETAAAIV